MSRIDSLLTLLTKKGVDCYFSASQLADELGRTRANVSSDLNRLCEQGLVKKNDLGRPVLYALKKTIEPKDSEETVLDKYLHQNSSLSYCVHQAKAAVLYPPYGMHILLLGETGVGKSMFAEKIYQYAQSKGRLKEDGKFVIFNCADYANNPQLLLSQLFGLMRGAYTGADRDKPGLFEEADGGVLLLDEVHRLPAEGQEMLFTYMDRRTFRRLGETDNERNADVLLICATTETPGSVLLTTFIRRIPMVIQIPNLESRSLEERYYLVHDFFEREALKLGFPIQVSVNSMRALLSYHCPANVGQLKSDVQLLCAYAYSAYVTNKQYGISITSYHLPSHIRNGLLGKQLRKEVRQLLSGITTRFITFESKKSFSMLPSEEEEDIYQIIENQNNDMKRLGMSDEQVYQEISLALKEYYTRTVSSKIGISDALLENHVGTEVYATVEKILSLASSRLHHIASDNIRHGLILHVYNAIKRIRQGQSIVNPRLPIIREELPQLYHLALESLKIIEADFRLIIPKDEAGFLALFFQLMVESNQEKQVVMILLVMHGDSTATSMAETANQLTGAKIVQGFDMKLEEKPDLVYQRIQTFLKGKRPVKEVLLLIDMGSLSHFAYRIEQDFNARVKWVVLASTLHAMEAARKASLGYPLHEVYKATRKVNELSEIPHHSLASVLQEKLFLLTLCTTGEGSAKVVLEHLKVLDLKDGSVEIVALQITDQVNFNQQVEDLESKGKIIGVISSFETSLRVPHYSLSIIFHDRGYEEIQRLIDKEVAYNQVSRELVPLLESINNPHIASDIRSTIEHIAENLGRELTAEMLIGTFCHIGCMLDRLKRGEPASIYKSKEKLLNKYPKVAQVVTRQCERLGSEYQVIIPEDEICYLTAFFTKEATLE